jgi:putative MFS transporter
MTETQQPIVSPTNAALSQTSKILNATVIVTALGYLVDVYDALIFNVTRVASLTDLGLSGDALTDAGIFILNMQLLGFLLGGLFFGIIGDKLGRKQSLLGSILLYSTATLACAFVQNVDVYATLRFIAGFGLAGEIGVGVALITEVMTKEKRTLGVTFFAFVGISGAVLAAIAAELLDWRTCYIIGGIAGLLLLITRSMILESGMFETIKNKNVRKGNILDILLKPALLKKYIASILLGAPIFFVIGMIWTLSPEISAALNVTGKVSAPITIGVGYACMMFGDVAAGLLSHYFKTRKKTILYFLISTTILTTLLLTQSSPSPFDYYMLSGLIGLSIGYWVNLISLGAEQFGTNLRATASTSIPNFARATLLPLNLILAAIKPDIGILYGVALMGCLAMICALISLYFLEETHGKDLNYTD